MTRYVVFGPGGILVDDQGAPLWHEADSLPEGALPLDTELEPRRFVVHDEAAQGPASSVIDLVRAGIAERVGFGWLARAQHLNGWRQRHRYCGSCGGSAEMRVDPIRTECAACGATVHPRISPCVIVLVHDGDRVLLVQAHRHRDYGWHSCIAGFVEAGETLEETIAREVREESGVDVGRLTFRGSQPWPFPDQLMIGFWAEYSGGGIRITDTEEIAEARWFPVNALPKHPSRNSIAGRLITDYAAAHLAGEETKT
jgi:NAD+ diphosphatase